MKNFDFNRFKQTLRWTLMSERRSIKATAIACTVAALGIQLMFAYWYHDPYSTELYELPRMPWAMSLCGYAFSIAMAFFASRVCSNVRSARQRATALMLPASKSEKYVARVVFCLVLLPLLALVCVVAATCVRLLLELVSSHPNITVGAGYFFGALKFNGVGGIVICLWNLSLFLLAGAFFRRVPFLWMTGILVTVFMFLAIAFSMLIVASNGRVLQSLSWMEIPIYILLALLTVLNVWLSWRIYEKLQIVQNRAFNV